MTGLSLVQLINSKGPAFKKLGLKADELEDAQAVALIQENPRIMVRPVLVKGNQGVSGFKEESFRGLLG